MSRALILAVACVLGASPALAKAASSPPPSAATGHDALYLAARIGVNSPLLAPAEKHALGVYLDGGPRNGLPIRGKIIVKADEVTCRMSNVDITLKSCDLRFGDKTVSLKDREAQALYATLIEAGVPGGGAAGSIIESVSALKCAIDPASFDQGGGADCAFTGEQ